MTKWSDKMVVNVEHQLDDWCNRCLINEKLGETTGSIIFHFIAKLAIVASAIKYLFWG